MDNCSRNKRKGKFKTQWRKNRAWQLSSYGREAWMQEEFTMTQSLSDWMVCSALGATELSALFLPIDKQEATVACELCKLTPVSYQCG